MTELITNVFTYGTLMIPSIMTAVTGKKYTGQKAWLKNYQRFRLKNETYPGMIEYPGATVEGIVYSRISDETFEILDRFEGRLYERREVVIRTLEKDHIEAYAYVIPAAKKELLSTVPWDKCLFIRDHYDDFINNYSGFENK